MRYYIQQGCLLTAIIMHFLTLLLQTEWPVGTWPLWLRITWASVFCVSALVGTWLACGWKLPNRKR
jgi:hypothetical protein